ncbi:hypothetical protein Hanom_Chr09g00769511 [Helianthus anomalus]
MSSVMAELVAGDSGTSPTTYFSGCKTLSNQYKRHYKYIERPFH